MLKDASPNLFPRTAKLPKTVVIGLTVKVSLMVADA